MQKINLIKLVAVFLLLPLTGCATIMTAAAPPEMEVEPGEKVAGSPAGFHYKMEREGNEFDLQRTPLCREIAENKEVYKKRVRGVIFAVCEIPIFGLGLVDWAVAGAIANSSETTWKITREKTGKVIVCGRDEPAAGKKIILQLSDASLLPPVITDDKGGFNLDKSIKSARGYDYINMFLKYDDRIDYLSTIPLYR